MPTTIHQINFTFKRSLISGRISCSIPRTKYSPFFLLLLLIYFFLKSTLGENPGSFNMETTQSIELGLYATGCLCAIDIDQKSIDFVVILFVSAMNYRWYKMIHNSLNNTTQISQPGSVRENRMGWRRFDPTPWLHWVIGSLAKRSLWRNTCWNIKIDPE